MAVYNINSLDIVSGKLLSPGYIVASWTDGLLPWNSSEFGGIDQLSMTPDEIWLPSFVQFGANEAEFIINSAWVRSNGTVVLILAGVFEAVCKLDVLHFPFDEHVCVFEILPASLDSTEIALSVSSVNDSIENYLEHGEWDIKRSVLSVREFKEPVSGKTFVTLLKTMNIARRSLFTSIHTCIPLILLCTLNTVIFVVPLKSGERISFSISILLNFVILTSSMSNSLPHNSLRLPLLSIFMTVTNVITTLGVIISVILCRMDHETIIPLPEGLKRLASKMISFRLRKWKRKPIVKPVHNSKLDIVDEDEIATSESMKSENPSGDANINVEITWSVFAELMDKVIFYINFIVIVTSILVFSNMIINS